MYILLKYNGLRAKRVAAHEESITYADGFDVTGDKSLFLAPEALPKT
jgi:hypothetical protein